MNWLLFIVVMLLLFSMSLKVVWLFMWWEERQAKRDKEEHA